MRLTRTRILVAAGALVAAATVTGSVLAAIPASAGPASGTTYVLVNQCTGGGQVKPSTIPLPGCMPSNELIGHVRWATWGSSAFGRGDLEVNNCTPSASCGPSKFTKYPILIVTWRSEPWMGKNGDDYFSRMTWIFTGKRPKGIPVTQTITWRPDAQ
jgi:hypothetical protein